MLYVPPSFSTDANASYVGKNVAAGKQGSKVPPGALEYPQREIMAVIAAAGLAGTNTDLTQLLQSINLLISLKTSTILAGRNIIGGNTVPFLASGTWLCPAGVTRARARGVGGGGGGGGSQSSSGGAASGGGAGGYFDGIFTVIPGTTYTITIGAGGIAGLANGSAPGNGGTTSFDAFASGTGGGGGLAANGNNAAPGGNGGSGIGGTVNLVGAAGGNGLLVGSIYFGGQGGAPPFLGGGYSPLGVVGQQGTRFGGGGGGGSYQNNGAAGSAGYLELTF